MGLSPTLSQSAEDLIREVLALEGREAVEAILVLSSYLLNWAAYKLTQEGAADVAQDYFAAARSFEAELLELLGARQMSGAEILRFPPKSDRG